MIMKNKLDRISFLVFCLLLAILAGGCHTPPEKKVVTLNNKAAESLAKQLRHNSGTTFSSREDTIIVTTIADVDRLEASSSMGRITTEQIASRLAQLGFNVTEVKVRGNLFVERGSGDYKTAGPPFSGEFVLSRNVEKIASEHAAVAVIAGTYAVGRTHSIVSLRAIDVATKRIIAGHDYAVPAIPWQWINPLPDEQSASRRPTPPVTGMERPYRPYGGDRPYSTDRY
jgi:hypothetical protein